MSTSFILLVVLFNENFKKTVFNRNVNNINNYIIFLAQNYQLKILFSENYWCLKNEFKCVLNWIEYFDNFIFYVEIENGDISTFHFENV